MEMLRPSFVIMQIGNPDLDKIYENFYKPALLEAGYQPKRIDSDNTGGLLPLEILEAIESAEIILADLTNERPNCYLEVGVTLGRGKKTNLILTCNETHFHESKTFVKGGKKVHFDLMVYDILFWSETNLEKLKADLIAKIKTRKVLVAKNVQNLQNFLLPDQWLEERRERTNAKLKENSLTGSIEIIVTPMTPTINFLQDKIKAFANEARIAAASWPLGSFIDNGTQNYTFTKGDGMLSEIEFKTDRYVSYDYYYFRNDGKIYFRSSLDEDTYTHGIGNIQVNNRIHRATELLLFISRYYNAMDLSKDVPIKIQISFSGIENRNLVYAHGRGVFSNPITENGYIGEVTTSLNEIENNIPKIVYEMLHKFFLLFNLSKVEFGFFEREVNGYIGQLGNNGFRI